jgi:hypothetical protein
MEKGERAGRPGQGDHKGTPLLWTNAPGKTFDRE